MHLGAAVIFASLSIGVPAAVAGGGGIGAPAGGASNPPEATGGGVSPGAGGYGFPLDVAFSWGDGFGAGRDHEGQDLFAPCGSPILAVRDGRVQQVGYEANAGNYVVIDGSGTKVDTMYAHMLDRTALRRRAHVAGGEQIGQVGSTGNASGCHLHFEIWSAPGWYEGGHPMPNVGQLLRSWAAAG
jgi:murein DD-endopeptidase MepM/ murein hydrolase activator NlpD